MTTNRPQQCNKLTCLAEFPRNRKLTCAGLYNLSRDVIVTQYLSVPPCCVVEASRVDSAGDRLGFGEQTRDGHERNRRRG